jgi:hypothetical protein
MIARLASALLCTAATAVTTKASRRASSAGAVLQACRWCAPALLVRAPLAVCLLFFVAITAPRVCVYQACAVHSAIVVGRHATQRVSVLLRQRVMACTICTSG